MSSALAGDAILAHPPMQGRDGNVHLASELRRRQLFDGLADGDAHGGNDCRIGKFPSTPIVQIGNISRIASGPTYGMDKKWLQAQLKERGHGAQAALAAYIGLSTSVTNKLVNADRKISADGADKIREFLAIPIDEMKAEISALPKAAPDMHRRDPSIEGRALDQIFPLTQGASNAFASLQYLQGYPDADWGDHLVDGETAKPQARRLLRIETDRMAPRYLIGETIAIERVAPKDGDHVWVEMLPKVAGERRPAMLRLLKEQDSTTLTLVQYRPRLHTTTVERKKIAALYRVLSMDELLALLGARLGPS